MSFAYLALFTGDYIRDTRALTPLEHGIYLLLLMHYWDTKSPIPLDEQDCSGIANCRSANEIDALRKILNKYFIRCEDGWYNKRMQQEIEKVERLSKTWSEAGKKGAQAKAKGRLRVGSALATTLSLSSSLSSHHPQKTKTLSRKRDVKPLAVEVLNFLNLKAGRAYRPTESNLSMIEARLLDGATLIDCKQVIAKKVREWGPDERMTLYLRPATLFNRTKFDQYVGELVEVNDGE